MKRFLAITAAFWLLFGAVAGAQTYTDSKGDLTVDTDLVEAGDTVTVSGEGFSPDTDVEVLLSYNGDDVILATVTADEDGDFSADVEIPADFTGDGVLFARGTAADGGTCVLAAQLSSGKVGRLAFTGTSARTPWLIAGSIVLIAVGSGALALGNRRRVLE